MAQRASVREKYARTQQCFYVQRVYEEILLQFPKMFISLVRSSLPLVAVAYLDGTLAIYDLKTQVLRHRCQHEVNSSRTLVYSPPSHGLTLFIMCHHVCR